MTARRGGWSRGVGGVGGVGEDDTFSPLNMKKVRVLFTNVVLPKAT